MYSAEERTQKIPYRRRALVYGPNPRDDEEKIVIITVDSRKSEGRKQKIRLAKKFRVIECDGELLCFVDHTAASRRGISLRCRKIQFSRNDKSIAPLPDVLSVITQVHVISEIHRLDIIRAVFPPSRFFFFYLKIIKPHY